METNFIVNEIRAGTDIISLVMPMNYANLNNWLIYHAKKNDNTAHLHSLGIHWIITSVAETMALKRGCNQ
jgi:hypothetical protein